MALWYNLSGLQWGLWIMLIIVLAQILALLLTYFVILNNFNS